MKTEANEPATPVSKDDRWTGLTKREMLAAMAMQGFLGNARLSADYEKTAKGALKMADALIKELNNTSTEN